MAYQTTNPFNGDVLKTYDTISDTQLETATAAAAAAAGDSNASWPRPSASADRGVDAKLGDVVGAGRRSLPDTTSAGSGSAGATADRARPAASAPSAASAVSISNAGGTTTIAGG